jgi:hypothetical protein
MMLVLCPTRGRPENATELLATFEQSRSLADSRLVCIVDADDPLLAAYAYHLPDEALVVVPATGCMNASLGEYVRTVLPATRAEVVGFVGDDHRFRSLGWDEAIGGLLSVEPGVAYANDLFQGRNLCTNWFVSRRIVDRFGMGLPTLRHLYLDNYWMTLAGGADCLHYLPEVIVEHMHVLAGKAEWDDGYRRVNAPGMYSIDSAAFGRWLDADAAADIAELRSILA